MGYAMATNVRKKLEKSCDMYVYDINREACERFKKESEAASLGRVEVASSAKDVAQHAMTIISMIPAGKHVRETYLDNQNGVAAALDPANAETDKQRVYVECSTIDIETARDVGTKLKEMGMGTYVDCPVSVCPSLHISIVDT